MHRYAPLPSSVTAPLNQLVSWLLWSCELVLLAVLITSAARLWMDYRNPEMREGRHSSTAVVVTLIAAAVASAAVPVAAGVLAP